MQVERVVPSGYCKGVIRAIMMVRRARQADPDEPIYILGMLVHNRYVVEAFKALGVTTLEEPGVSRRELLESIDHGTVVFTAHGIDPAIKARAREKGLKIIDATCIDVTRSMDNCRDYLKKGYVIIYLGIRNHPEAEAVCSLSADIHLVTCDADLDVLQLEGQKIVITSQTTMSQLDNARRIETILARYPQAIVAEEICNATRMRQNALMKLEGYDHLIVVGDPRSNNTRQLAGIGRSAVPEVMCVENAAALADIDTSGWQKVAVTAGASTPSYLTDQVIRYLQTGDPVYLQTKISRIFDNQEEL